MPTGLTAGQLAMHEELAEILAQERSARLYVVTIGKYRSVTVWAASAAEARAIVAKREKE